MTDGGGTPTVSDGSRRDTAPRHGAPDACGERRSSEPGASRDAAALQAPRAVIEAQAREWLSWLYSGETSERDCRRFEAWLAERPAHRAALRELYALWTSLDRVPGIEQTLGQRPEQDLGAGAHGVPHAATSVPALRLPRRAWRPTLARQRMRKVWKVSLAAGLAAMVALFALSPTGEPSVERHYRTDIGQTRAIEFTDGTHLVLRADTEIVASLSKARRSVVIERGGAYFDVAHDQARPFVVSTAGIEVRVRGTAFDVLRGPGSVTVSVLRGRVAVANAMGSTSEPPQVVELTAGQRVRVDAGGRFGPVTGFDETQLLSWRTGRFSYVDARLEDIVADINRYRSSKIHIEDDALRDLRVSTTFRIGQAEQMLAGIAVTEPVMIVRSPSGIVLRRRED